MNPASTHTASCGIERCCPRLIMIYVLLWGQLGWAAMASAIMEEMVEDGFPLEAKTYGIAVKVGGCVCV